MLKRFSVALAALFVLASPAFGAGSVPGFSLTPQFDKLGQVAPGCKLYVIQAGTVSTPQNPYQDSGLTILQTNPIICDAAGRLPQWFVADGTIKLRLTTRAGTEVFVQDSLLVVGASSGGGGGSPVDPTTIIATGDVKPRYGTGIVSGFVRANGRTIGSATSGASERANSDCQALFEYLWGADVSLTVSTGRGASANADWVANKTITLPDFRGAGIGGLADMGNSATTVLTSTYFGTDPTVLGAFGGAQSKTLGTTNLPAYTPSGTFSGTIAALSLSVTGTASVTSSGVFLQGTNTDNFQSIAGSGQFDNLTKAFVASSGSITGTASGNYTPSGVFTGSAQGGASTAFATVGPMKLVTVYIKL